MPAYQAQPGDLAFLHVRPLAGCWPPPHRMCWPPGGGLYAPWQRSSSGQRTPLPASAVPGLGACYGHRQTGWRASLAPSPRMEQRRAVDQHATARLPRATSARPRRSVGNAASQHSARRLARPGAPSAPESGESQASFVTQAQARITVSRCRSTRETNNEPDLSAAVAPADTHTAHSCLALTCSVWKRPGSPKPNR